MGESCNEGTSHSLRAANPSSLRLGDNGAKQTGLTGLTSYESVSVAGAPAGTSASGPGNLIDLLPASASA